MYKKYSESITNREERNENGIYRHDRYVMSVASETILMIMHGWSWLMNYAHGDSQAMSEIPDHTHIGTWYE